MKAKVLSTLLALALLAPTAAPAGPRSFPGASPAAAPGVDTVFANSRFDRTKPVKHVILFIGDGMQLAHEVAASRYLYGKDYGLVFHDFPFAGDVATWDVSTYNKYAAAMGYPAFSPGAVETIVGYDPRRGGARPYPLQTTGIDDGYFVQPGGRTFATDSASAGTAWTTGYKTDDGNLAWLPGDPPNGRLETIAEILRKRKGFSIGVVSTVPFSHATPAAHVSHNTSRNNYHAIAHEILFEVKPDVVIGGGFPSPNAQYISPQDYAAFASGSVPDYVFVQRTPGADGSLAVVEAAHQAVADNKKLFGLFGGPGGNFESPEPQDLPGTPLIAAATIENPTLAAASLAALKVLSQDPDGFFVAIEQGDIDWANHANDFERMVGTMADLNAAVRAVVDFVNRDGDNIDWTNTLLLVHADHGNSYLRLPKVLPAGDLPTQTGVGQCGYGGPACTYPDGDVTYATTSHTNELTRVYGLGNGIQLFGKYQGSWYPCTRIIDNTHLFHLMTEAAGVPLSSPYSLASREPACR